MKEILFILRSRKEEVLLILKQGGDVSAFERVLDLEISKKENVKTLVIKRSLGIRGLDETIYKEKVVAALVGPLGKFELDGSCRIYSRFDEVWTAVVQLAEADALRLLQLKKVRVEWVNRGIRKHVEVAWCFR